MSLSTVPLLARSEAGRLEIGLRNEGSRVTGLKVEFLRRR